MVTAIDGATVMFKRKVNFLKLCINDDENLNFAITLANTKQSLYFRVIKADDIINFEYKIDQFYQEICS